MDDQEDTRKTITVEEAAKRLGIGRSAAYGAVHRGQIPAIRLGKRILVPLKGLDRLLHGGPLHGVGTQELQAKQ